MAKLGQKYKTYDQSLKIKSINEYLNSKLTIDEICAKYDITSRDTFDSWLEKYRKYGTNIFVERRGCATSKTCPFKGRPRVKFSSKEEEEKYTSARAEYKKSKALEKEKKNRQKEAY